MQGYVCPFCPSGCIKKKAENKPTKKIKPTEANTTDNKKDNEVSWVASIISLHIMLSSLLPFVIVFYCYCFFCLVFIIFVHLLIFLSLCCHESSTFSCHLLSFLSSYSSLPYYHCCFASLLSSALCSSSASSFFLWFFLWFSISVDHLSPETNLPPPRLWDGFCLPHPLKRGKNPKTAMPLHSFWHQPENLGSFGCATGTDWN